MPRTGSSYVSISLVLGVLACGPARPLEEGATVPSLRSRGIAAYTVEHYAAEAVATLGDVVSFETVHVEGMENASNPEFQAMTGYLRAKAEAFGLDFEDHGAVVIVGLGDSDDRVGIVAHGDVQPADATKWASDPFSLDVDSEPGRFVGRGTEDDKGPLVSGLYAMRALKERDLPLAKRIELIIAYTEESDWEPIRAFLATWEPPAINIAFDSEYPVVIAEKGWGQIFLTLPKGGEAGTDLPSLESFSGGSFLSQVPEDAVAKVAAVSDELEAELRAAATAAEDIKYGIERWEGSLVIHARGVSAHSSTPWEGRNAITHLADLLGQFEWPDTAAARMVRLVNDLIGTGDNAERFGALPYSDSFMGPLTLTLATLEDTHDALVAGISFRRPVGRSASEVEASARAAIDAWKQATGAEELTYETAVYDPYWVQDAPQVPALLEVFSHYTGIEDPQPISIGGGTNVRLLPNGVSFGPSMPGEVYTGHSEHEFISREQFLLNLEMYTAMLAELAGE